MVASVGWLFIIRLTSEIEFISLAGKQFLCTWFAVLQNLFEQPPSALALAFAPFAAFSYVPAL